MGMLDLIREYDKKKEKQRWLNDTYRGEKFEECVEGIKLAHECKHFKDDWTGLQHEFFSTGNRDSI